MKPLSEKAEVFYLPYHMLSMDRTNCPTLEEYVQPVSYTMFLFYSIGKISIRSTGPGDDRSSR